MRFIAYRLRNQFKYPDYDDWDSSATKNMYENFCVCNIIHTYAKWMGNMHNNVREKSLKNAYGSLNMENCENWRGNGEFVTRECLWVLFCFCVTWTWSNLSGRNTNISHIYKLRTILFAFKYVGLFAILKHEKKIPLQSKAKEKEGRTHWNQWKRMIHSGNENSFQITSIAAGNRFVSFIPNSNSVACANPFEIL